MPLKNTFNNNLEYSGYKNHISISQVLFFQTKGNKLKIVLIFNNIWHISLFSLILA
jgi:hypothetical protein